MTISPITHACIDKFINSYVDGLLVQVVEPLDSLDRLLIDISSHTVPFNTPCDMSGGGAPGRSDRFDRAQRLQRRRVLRAEVPSLGRIHTQNLRQQQPQQRIIVVVGIIIVVVVVVVGGKPVTAQRIQRTGNYQPS